MFIRFVSGEIDEDSHVAAGLFCAASQLRWSEGLPDYDFEALTELKDWFNVHLPSPFDHLPRGRRYEQAICWFKPTAREYLERAPMLAKPMLLARPLWIFNVGPAAGHKHRR